MNTKKLAVTALLTALAIVIPFAVFLKIIIPPFTATLGSHVPMFISMVLGPEVAIMTGIGSALGFGLTLGPLIGARAFMHIFVGLLGSKLIKKGMSFGRVATITAPLHGLLEVLVVTPFVDFNAYQLLVVTGIGTILHHCVDAFISALVIKFIPKSALNDIIKIKQEA
ncbi:ECF transporter S component [Defluviitalea phaphyphila]|uniref:ECF transporter S component n=1 Tax=Defluviitalea phaphyphila TaxID=1473580 RepID=UPI001187594C|nr:ECF transporter S component [Defluviitalea phaphyphila]